MKASTRCLVSRHSVCVRQFFQVTLKVQGIRDTVKCEPWKKEVWTPNVVLISKLRESKVTYGSEDSGDLSLRDACLGKPISMNKRSFTPSNVDSRCKDNNGKEMKGGHKEGTQKQKVRKVHFAALMDIRHIQKYEYILENVRENNLKCGHKYEYIPVNVRKSNLKCGNYHAQMKYAVLELREEIDEAGIWAENLNWDNHQRSGWRWTPMNSSDNECKILQYKVPALNIPKCPFWILTNRGLWMTVIARKGRKLRYSVFWIFAAYRGTSRERFTIFEQRGNEEESSSVHLETVAFMMRVKPGLLEKQQRQRRQQQCHVNTSENKVQLQKRKESFEKTKIKTTIPGWQTCRKHLSETFIFKYVYFDTMIDVSVKKREQRIGMLYIQ